MNADKVIEKILAQAREEASKIKTQTDKSAAAEKMQLDKELAEYEKQTEMLAKAAGEERRSHLLAAARMETAKDLLAEKRQILNEIFATAQVHLENLPDDDYRRIMTELMVQAVEVGDEEVVVDTNETRIDADFVKQVNKKLASDGKGTLKLASEKQNIRGGFILSRGKVKNNVSLAVLLSQARGQLEMDLAKELFAD
ncbi:V-type ATP synthase subunit E [Planctomycetota bacterium]